MFLTVWARCFCFRLQKTSHLDFRFLSNLSHSDPVAVFEFHTPTNENIPNILRNLQQKPRRAAEAGVGVQ